jgi:hypothetical protein
MHLYIVVDCKTQDCRTVYVLMHLGEKGKTAVRVEYWMSYPLMVNCPTCGKTYDYSDAECKFWQQELPSPRLDIQIGSPHPRGQNSEQ